MQILPNKPPNICGEFLALITIRLEDGGGNYTRGRVNSAKTLHLFVAISSRLSSFVPLVILLLLFLL